MRSLGRLVPVIALAALLSWGVAGAVALPKHTDSATVEKSWVHKPHRFLHRIERFTPVAHPTPAQVHKIERKEQKKWGGPSLRRRVFCESGDRWYATNGPYKGLLQIGPWWSYAWSRTPKKVVVRSHHFREAPVYRFKQWSDGTITRKHVHDRRQKVLVTKKGRLPSNADQFHGWAAIRVGQRAVSGDGPSASWSCGL